MNYAEILYKALLEEIESKKRSLDLHEKNVKGSEEDYRFFLEEINKVKKFIKEKIDQKNHAFYEMRGVPQRYLKKIDKERLNLLKRIEILESKYVNTHR